MIQHHPSDELLLAAAAGRLDRGAAIVVGAHVEGCARCRESLRLFESVGGAMLEAIEPALMAPQALARTLAAIDALPAVPPPAAPRKPPSRPPLPAGTAWPQSLGGLDVSNWRWLGPGMRWARVELPHEPEANVFLLRIGGGKSLASHSHSGIELTQVLHGAFHDGRAMFSAGDFDAADGSVRHQPVLQPGSECICLASVQGRLQFDGVIGRLIGSLVGI